MEHTWNYGGHAYPFDISESESMARMCSGLNTLREEIGTPAGGSASENLRGQCMIIRRFFDTVLGEGMGEAVCGTAFSADAHTTAYMEFILFVSGEVSAFREKVAAVEEKYMNRAANLSPADAYGA